MLVFIEFNFSEKQKISVNINLITNVLQSKENATIYMGRESFGVLHKYEDVIKMIECYIGIIHIPLHSKLN